MSFHLRPNVQYRMAEMKVCDKLSIFKLRPHSHAYQGTWYLNTNVPEKQRQDINQEISKMRMEGEIRTILDDFFKSELPKACGKQTPPKIGGHELGTFFAILVVPPAIVMVMALIFGICLQRHARHDLDRIARGEENDKRG